VSFSQVILRSLAQALFVALISIIFGDPLITTLGLYLWGFTFFLYLNHLGKTIPVIELLLLIATSQWILGPVIDYRTQADHFKYYMYVDELYYMNYVVPGTLFFTIAVLINYPKYDLKKIDLYLREVADKLPNVAYFLIFIGIVSDFTRSSMPAFLQFVFYLLANLKYIGAVLILYRSKGTQKWWILAGVMVLTIISSLQAGMFHDLVLWSAFLLSFIVLNLKWGFYRNISIVVCGAFSLFILQSIKGDYRSQLWGERNTTSNFPVVEQQNQQEYISFFDLVLNRLDNLDIIFSESYLNEINVRLNQGWIISSILNHVPYFEPFADGETINTAVTSSLLPRFLAPGKAEAGGQENFERFTGLYLYSFTSMGISILGEAYANYGKYGGWIFMVIWGLVLSYIFRLLVRYSFKEPLLYIFFPLIFLQVVKAETELLVVLNHLLKSIVLTIFLLWVVNQRYGKNLKSIQKNFSSK